MDPRVAPDQEAQRGHRGPSEHESVECVDAIVRLRRGVSGLSEKLDVEVDHREHERVDLVPVAGVVHERGVDALECATLHELDLAIAALLGGAADDADPTAHAVEHVAEREERADRRRPHEVVAAPVADPRKRVVFAEYRDDGTARPRLGDEGRLDAAGRAPDRDLLRLQVVRERARREALLESELGARMDLQREPVERLCARVDALGDPLLTRRGVQVVLRLPRTRRGTRGQNELGQDESGNDKSPRDDAQSVHDAKKTERGEKGADLDAATYGPRPLRPARPRACECRVPLLDGHADQRDRARHADGGPAHNGRDREGLGRIAGQQHEHHSGDRCESAQREERPRQLSSTLERGSMRRGRATCSPPAAIGACASVSIALEARESARSVSSNFFVAFSRWRPS